MSEKILICPGCGVRNKIPEDTRTDGVYRCGECHISLQNQKSKPKASNEVTLKLPNFYDFEPLNSLKSKMGIHPNVYGDLTVLFSANRLTELELERLTSSAGLDISADDLTVLPDGTLAYKDSRVILYIRDVTVYGNKDIQPRYHLANCATLKQMRDSNRFDRYVVSTKTDGRFDLNIIEQGVPRNETHDLSICQNCLNALQFDGFKFNRTQIERQHIVKQFKIDRFFEKYPRSLHTHTPTYNSNNAPINIYSKNFNEISLEVKNDTGWSCQKCGVILAKPENRRWLHTHHKNGLKHDNRKENLEALCIDCHAEEPHHSHLRGTPDYINFTKAIQ